MWRIYVFEVQLAVLEVFYLSMASLSLELVAIVEDQNISP